MKIKKITKIKKIYLVDNIEKIKNKDMSSFLFCGDWNWDYYFSSKIKNTEKIKNTKLTEFYNKNDLKKYLKNINKIDFLDYCIEENYFAILELK